MVANACKGQALHALNQSSVSAEENWKHPCPAKADLPVSVLAVDANLIT